MAYYRGDYYAGDPGIGTELMERGTQLLSKYYPALKKALPYAGAAAAGAAAEYAAERAAGGEERRRYRRMNPLNPRALRRSMRRVQAFARFARKTMQFTKTHRMKKHRRR